MKRAEYLAVQRQYLEPRKSEARDLLRLGKLSVSEIAVAVDLSYSTVFKLAQSMNIELPKRKRVVAPAAPVGKRRYQLRTTAAIEQHKHSVDALVLDQQRRATEAEREARRRKQVELELRALNNPFLRAARAKFR